MNLFKIFMSICLFIYVYVWAHLWRPEDNHRELPLSIHRMNSGDWTQVMTRAFACWAILLATKSYLDDFFHYVSFSFLGEIVNSINNDYRHEGLCCAGDSASTLYLLWAGILHCLHPRPGRCHLLILFSILLKILFFSLSIVLAFTLQWWGFYPSAIVPCHTSGVAVPPWKWNDEVEVG